jgi:hypothetical protein
MLVGDHMKRRSNQQTSSAAVLATGAELSRRGYDVTFTLGNTGKIDMLCAVPDGPTFKIQVKGLSNKNAFFINESFFDGDAQDDLYLVVVYVPKIDGPGALEFYVLTHAQAQAEFGKMPKVRRDGRLYKAGEVGLNWGGVSRYKENWGAFP